MKYNKEIDKQNILTFEKTNIRYPHSYVYHCVLCENETSIDYSYSNKGHKMICIKCKKKIFKDDYTKMYKWIEGEEKMLNIKSKYMNYFKEGKLFQWDERKTIQTIIDLGEEFPRDLEFCLAKKDMDKFLKYKNPKLTLGKKLRVQSGSMWTTLELCGEPLIMPKLDFANEVNIDIDKLKTASKFVASDNKKPILTGVNIGKKQIQATDSFFAYRSEIEPNETTITLTTTFINEIEASGVVNIKFNNSLSYYLGEGIIIIGVLLDGNYPSLERLFDYYNFKSVEIPMNTLTELLQFSDNKEDEKILFTPQGIKVYGLDSETQNEEPLNIDCKILFQLKRFATALKYCSGDMVTLRYISSDRQTFLNDDILVLPIRIVE